MRQLKKEIVGLFLIFSLICSCMNVVAADELGYKLTLSSETVKIGDTVDVIVGITNYTEDVSGIRGIQIDIEEINPEILSVVTYESLIADSSAFLNDATYNSTDNFARYLYMNRSVSLDTSYGDIYHITFRVNGSLTEDGSITLPISVKYATWDEEITLASEFTIYYTVSETDDDDDEGEDETEVTSVDITWGALTYEYVEEDWNNDTHSYATEGWNDDETGYITVTNTGTSSESIEVSYETERTDITGTFVDDAGEAESTFDLGVGEDKTVYLELSGEPDEELENSIIGEVTVTIGGE